MDPDSKDRGAGDLWELTIDDLFSTSDAAASELGTAVPGPYTIDLCDSVEPASEIAPCLRDFDQLQVYQVTDWKDDRLVFRLRLGPIDSELEADAILSIVRRDYPDATTLPMGDDDLRMISIANGSAATRAAGTKVVAAAPVAKIQEAEQAGKVEVAARTATSAPAPAPATAAPVETTIDPAATLPSTMAGAEPTDFAAAFRDLAAELLALDPKPARPAAKPANDATAAAPPPVLTAVIPRTHAPTPTADRAAPDVTTSAPVGAPPVLNIDAVARPPRERAERRAGKEASAGPPRARAAVAPPTPATKATPREAEPAVAARPLVVPGAAAAPSTPPAAARPTAPPVTVAATPVAPAYPSAPTPAAAAAAAPIDHATMPDSAANTAPSTPAVPATATQVAKPAEPRRDPQPESKPTPIEAPVLIATTRAASAPLPDLEPPAAGPAERGPRAPEPPRVALRGTPAAAAPFASPAMPPKSPPPAPPASRATATMLAVAPGTPAAAPGAASARVNAPPRSFDLELELLPDDLETPVSKSVTPNADSPADAAVTTARFEAFAASTVTLELVVDEPRKLPEASPKQASPPTVTPGPPPSSARPVAPKTPLPATTPAAKAPPPKLPPAASTAPARTAAAPPRPPVTPPPPAPKPTAVAPPPAGTPAAPATRGAPAAVSPPRPATTTAASTVTPSKAAASAAPPATAPKKTVPAIPAAGATARKAAPVAAAPKAPAAAAPKAAERPSLPAIDSTQTLRALVVPKDPAAPTEKLIVIQLVLSEQEIAPESVPDLAIFKEYRLYSAIGHHEGKVMHALRLGFFSDEGPAEMVAGYLRSYFEAPVVTRISVEERERFATRRIAARKEGGDTGVHTAIELASAPSAPSISLADLSARVQAEPPAKSGSGRPRG